MVEDKYSAVTRGVTIVDVARESGVSYSTVSRVLNGYEFVKESTRQRVLEAASRLGYVANLQARSLAGGRSNIIGLLVPGLDTEYLGQIARGVDEELQRTGYDLMLYTTHRHQGQEYQYIASIANGLVDGVLLIVPLVPSEYLQALPRSNFPYVLIDQADDDPRSWVVDSTNWQGAYDAVSYLIKTGHRRIGHITGDIRIRSAIDRHDGYRAALADHGIPLDEELIFAGNFHLSSGSAGTRCFLDLPDPPTAIFAANDVTAFGVMEEVRARQLRIPEDISIVGFDDIPQASLVYPKLTTVRQPLGQMGRVAVKLLLERIEKPDRPSRRVTLATDLIVRDSTVQNRT